MVNQVNLEYRVAKDADNRPVSWRKIQESTYTMSEIKFESIELSFLRRIHQNRVAEPYSRRST